MQIEARLGVARVLAILVRIAKLGEDGEQPVRGGAMQPGAARDLGRRERRTRVAQALQNFLTPRTSDRLPCSDMALL